MIKLNLVLHKKQYDFGDLKNYERAYQILGPRPSGSRCGSWTASMLLAIDARDLQWHIKSKVHDLVRVAVGRWHLQCFWRLTARDLQRLSKRPRWKLACESLAYQI